MYVCVCVCNVCVTFIAGVVVGRLGSGERRMDGWMGGWMD